jgi:ABC-type transporter Mla MlaB component
MREDMTYIENKNRHQNAVLVLEGDLTVDKAGALKIMLQDSLKNAESVAIHFKDNHKIDITFPQLLCSAHHSAFLSGKNLNLSEKIPDNLKNTLKSAGYMQHPVCSFDKDRECLLGKGVGK